MKNLIAACDPPCNWAAILFFNSNFERRRLAVLPSPSWDGSRVLFEIRGGLNRIPCAISRAALDVLGETRHFGGPGFVGCFLTMRGQIEMIARHKLSEMPGGLDGLVGTLNIWVSDLDELSPYGGAAESQKFVHRLNA